VARLAMQKRTHRRNAGDAGHLAARVVVQQDVSRPHLVQNVASLKVALAWPPCTWMPTLDGISNAVAKRGTCAQTRTTPSHSTSLSFSRSSIEHRTSTPFSMLERSKAGRTKVREHDEHWLQSHANGAIGDVP